MKEKELNREERNKTVMETGALVMAEFYADWCPHCQKMMPIVKEFKELLLSCYGKGRLCGDNPAR